MCMIKFPHCCCSAVRSTTAGLLGFAAAVLMLLSSLPARADVAWTLTTTGDWFVATNWGGGLPLPAATADIYHGGTATITTRDHRRFDSLSLGSTAG